MATRQSATNRVAGLIDTSTSTPIDFQSATPPVTGQVPTATSPTTISWQTPATGAPSTAQFLVLATDPTLNFERVFTPGAGITGTDAGPNSTYTVAVDPAASIAWTGTTTFQDTKFFIVDAVDATKRLRFDITGTTGLTSVVSWAPTSAQTVTIPDASDTFAMLALAQTLTNKTIDSTTNIVRANKLATTGAAVVVDTAAPPTLNQVLRATSATAATWQTISSGMLPWTDVTGATATLAADNGYVPDNVAVCVLTLPTTAAFGTIIAVVGKGSGGWKIAQNTGQTIVYGNQLTTAGATGFVSSTNANDAIEMLCVSANTTWTVRSSIGNHTVN